MEPRWDIILHHTIARNFDSPDTMQVLIAFINHSPPFFSPPPCMTSTRHPPTHASFQSFVGKRKKRLNFEYVSQAFLRQFLQQNNADATSLGLIWSVFTVDSSIDGFRSPVVQVVMKRSVSGTELQLFQEQRVIMEGQGIEDVEFGL